MNPFLQHAKDLVEKAKELHARERDISLESVDLVGEMLRRNVGGHLLLTSENLARRVGLTPNQFWKRAQAARVLARFPKFRELVAKREASVTTLAIVAPRLTAANAAIFVEGIRGKSVTEVRKLVGATDFHGKSLVAKSCHEMNSLLEHALEVARHSGRAMTREALLKEALGFWLEEWDIPSLKKEA